MENSTNCEAPIREYKEERFEFAIYVNEFIICKRNFRIYNYIEKSMNTLDFKETVDEVVHMIDEDLKSKSRVYTWRYFNPQDPQATEELVSPTIEPWSCTFKFVVYDNKREVISKIWDGYAYPRFVRDRVDLSNKNVRVMNREGQVFVYDKESFFNGENQRFTFDQDMLRGMIMDKDDVLLAITKKICEACSPSKDIIHTIDKEKAKKGFDPKENAKFLEEYATSDVYGNDDITKAHSEGELETKEYIYSLHGTNRKIEKEWEKLLQKKTSNYYKNLF